MRRAAAVDANQPDIVKALRKLPGVTVRDTHCLGGGFTDIAVGYKGRTYLFELKDPAQPPSKRRLTEDEQVFHLDWKGHVAIAMTLERILEEISYEVAA